MSRLTRTLLAITLPAWSSGLASAQRPEALWYATNREESVQSFLAHADLISIVAPQVFAMSGAGAIAGRVDPRVVAKAREKKVKLVPLVMNPGFDQAMVHRVLPVPAVRKRAVRERPVAGFPWMQQSLEYVLSLGVPPEKISLGIPSYSDWWYATYAPRDGARSTGGDISYATGVGLLARHGVEPVWDDRQKTLHAVWENDGVFEHLFLEDARAFRAKLELVSAHGLRGYSVWVLGTEDPKVWEAVGPAPSPSP